MILSTGKRLVVKEIITPQEEKTEKLILLPNEKKFQAFAVVIAIGEEIDSQVRVGDIVVLPDDAGIPITLDGEQLLSIADNQILALLREDT